MALVVKNLLANSGHVRDMSLIPVFIPWRRAWQPTPIFLPGKSHGQRILARLTVHCVAESDMSEAT